MNEFQTILSDTANRLFTDNLTKDTRIAAEDGTWPQALWQAVEENGFCRILVSEARGGAGASWSDAMVLLKACGLHAVPLPLAETIVAAWFLDQAGLDVPDGPLTFGPAELEGQGTDIRLAAPCARCLTLPKLPMSWPSPLRATASRSHCCPMSPLLSLPPPSPATRSLM